jgi:type VI secretion system protein ImpC
VRFGRRVAALSDVIAVDGQRREETVMPPNESLQHKLNRVRRPHQPVRITYEVETAGRVIQKELPFVVGVLADLAGHPDPDAEPPPGLESPRRRFVDIHRDNFDQVMSEIRPRLALRVANELRKDGTQIAVELHFRRIEDFEPAHVVRQVEPLRKLLEARQRLAELWTKVENNDRLDPLLQRIIHDKDQLRQLARESGRPTDDSPAAGTSAPIRAEDDCPDLIGQLVEGIIDGKIAVSDDTERMLKTRIAELDQLVSDQLNAIMHDPEFQKLEASWRGLRYLVFESETGELLKIRVLDTSKDELLRDMERAGESDRSGLFEKVYAAEYEVFGGTPYAVLIGDFEFGEHPRDIGLLGRIARVAAAAHAPFVAGASPKLFHSESFTELANPRDPAQIFEGVEYAPWNAFRASADSRYVALCLPHILMRAPYGEARPVEEFRFEEDVAGPDDKKYLWGNAAYAWGARITDAVARYGWCARIRGVNGGLVRGLPCRSVLTDESEIALKCPTDVLIMDWDRRQHELAMLGFISLVPLYNTGDAVFFSAQSCHKPARYLNPDAQANAILSAQLPCILTTSRFAHYLKVMARDKIVKFMEVGDLAKWLNDWIQNYVVANPEDVSDAIRAMRPLADARVDVRPMAGKPGLYEVVAYLRPHHQLGTPSTAMRLVAELPKMR